MKALGWAAGLGATAGGAYLLLHDSSSSPSTSGRQGPSVAAEQGTKHPPESQSGKQTARHLILAASGVSGLIGVACGAFDFHGLKRCATRKMVFPRAACSAADAISISR